MKTTKCVDHGKEKMFTPARGVVCRECSRKVKALKPHCPLSVDGEPCAATPGHLGPCVTSLVFHNKST